MRLQIGPSIGNNKVRLDFRRGPDKPSNTPSYEIEKVRADEFVREYNRQEKQLLNLTLFSMSIFSLLGWVASLHKQSWLSTLISVSGGFAVGLGVGSLVASTSKNKLMDKYNVKEFSI